MPFSAAASVTASRRCCQLAVSRSPISGAGADPDALAAGSGCTRPLRASLRRGLRVGTTLALQLSAWRRPWGQRAGAALLWLRAGAALLLWLRAGAAWPQERATAAAWPPGSRRAPWPGSRHAPWPSSLRSPRPLPPGSAAPSPRARRRRCCSPGATSPEHVR